MNKKQWVVLLALYTLYILLGALVFQALEEPQAYSSALEEVMAERRLQRLALETLTDIQANGSDVLDKYLELLQATEDLYGVSVLPRDINVSESSDIRAFLRNITSEEVVIEDKWNLWNTFYFTFITITTIGYGHLSPHTDYGQQFCILYSLFGIPLNTLVFVALANFYSDYVLTEEDRGGSNGRSTAALVLRALLYLAPGLFLYLVVPALVVMTVEDWSFLQSFYYSFITLSTIGYGDYVAGYPTNYGGWDIVYKMYIMLWTMFGLSYIIMVITFLMDVFRSEKIRKIEKQTSKLLKKRTVRLLDMVNRYVAEHQESHLYSNGGYAARDAGRLNAAFATTETSETRENVTFDGQEGLHGKNSTPYNNSHEGSLAHMRCSCKMEGVAKMLSDNPYRSVSVQPSHSSLSVNCRRLSLQLDARDECCKDLQTLAKLAFAVEELVYSEKELADNKNIDRSDAIEVSTIKREKNACKVITDSPGGTETSPKNYTGGHEGSKVSDLTIKF